MEQTEPLWSQSVLSPAPAEFNGAGIYLVQDIRENFLLFKCRGITGIVQGCFDLPYYVANIGHGFNAPLSERTWKTTGYILPE